MIRHLLTETTPYSELPLARMDDRIVLAIENAIRIGWDRIKATKSGRHILALGSEDEITSRLQDELNALRHTRVAYGFTKSQFQTITRSAAYRSYNAQHLNKSPDLVIRLVCIGPATPIGLELYDAMFVECKPLSAKHSLREYGENGIVRFVEGQYAWAMPHAMMVAYVSNSKTLPHDLDVLTAAPHDTSKRKYECAGPAMPCPFSRGVHVTAHERPWSYKASHVPGDIELRHLWLRVN
jgi:hypothetical protein